MNKKGLNMRISKDVTINLSQDEIKDIIVTYIRQRMYPSVTTDDITFLISTKTSEDYDERFQVVTHSFDGCVIKIQENRG